MRENEGYKGGCVLTKAARPRRRDVNAKRGRAQSGGDDAMEWKWGHRRCRWRASISLSHILRGSDAMHIGHIMHDVHAIIIRPTEQRKNSLHKRIRTCLLPGRQKVDALDFLVGKITCCLDASPVSDPGSL